MRVQPTAQRLIEALPSRQQISKRPSHRVHSVGQGEEPQRPRGTTAVPHSSILHRPLRTLHESLVTTQPCVRTLFTPASDSSTFLPFKPCVLHFIFFRSPGISCAIPPHSNFPRWQSRNPRPPGITARDRIPKFVFVIKLYCPFNGLFSREWCNARRKFIFRERLTTVSSRRHARWRNRGDSKVVSGGSSSRKRSLNPVMQSRLTAILFGKRR